MSAQSGQPGRAIPSFEKILEQIQGGALSIEKVGFRLGTHIRSRGRKWQYHLMLRLTSMMQKKTTSIAGEYQDLVRDTHEQERFLKKGSRE